MKIEQYYHDVLVPGNVAVSALRRAGLPVDVARIREFRAKFLADLVELKKFVTGEAAKRGRALSYDSQTHSIDPGVLADFLFSPESAGGYGLEVRAKTEKGNPSTADEGLSWYASLAVPRPDDDPLVRAVLKIRSLAGAVSKHLDKWEACRRADGCIHPRFNWALRTARLSAEDPPVHQIPERSDMEVADAIKSCIVPRVSPATLATDEPLGRGDDWLDWLLSWWDPREHGTCWRWDISGAEAAIRAAMLTHRFCSKPDPIAWEYIRLGKDIHSKTASLIYGVPEGTYKKGSYQRDAVGKPSFFAWIFGAKKKTMRDQIWRQARMWLDDEEANRLDGMARGYTGLVELYERDKVEFGRLGYSEDAYGRRRSIPVPKGAHFDGERWRYGKEVAWEMDHAFHIMANTPTQSTNAIDNVFMLALLYHGEYVDLRVPPMWEAEGLHFPEAASWQLHEGAGPGGKPLRAWHMNTVHDSGWGDSAPGHLEPTAKVIWRRCHAVPLDWRLEADVPYRIDFQVGPDMSRLVLYNKVAKKLGLDPLPKR